MKKILSILLLSVFLSLSIVSPVFAGYCNEYSSDSLVTIDIDSSALLVKQQFYVSEFLVLAESLSDKYGEYFICYDNDNLRVEVLYAETAGFYLNEEGMMKLDDDVTYYTRGSIDYDEDTEELTITPYIYSYNGGYFANIVYDFYDDKVALYSTVNFYDAEGNVVFLNPVLLPELVTEIQGVETQRLHQEVVGVMMILVLCGVSCLALLIILKVFGKVLRHFLP